MNKLVRPGLRKRISIASRARRLTSSAQAEWTALASRLGVASAHTDTRSARVAAVSQQLAEGAYQVDAEMVASRLISRLLQKIRSASH